jgi:hypothetical protein
MNLRCFYCQTPFTLSTDEKIAALRKMHAEDLHHYDAHCPRCGRANPVSRERLEMFTPGWEAAIKAPVMGAVGGSMPAKPAAPASSFSSTPAPMMERVEPKTAPAPAMKKEAAAPTRQRHAPAAKKAARKAAAAPKRKVAVKKAAAKPKKKTAAKAKPKKSAVKSKARKTTKAKAKKR